QHKARAAVFAGQIRETPKAAEPDRRTGRRGDKGPLAGPATVNRSAYQRHEEGSTGPKAAIVLKSDRPAKLRPLKMPCRPQNRIVAPIMRGPLADGFRADGRDARQPR